VTTSKARNEGAKRAIPRSHLMFLDSDVILKPTTLKKLSALVDSNPKVGAVGALYLTSNTSLFEKIMWHRYLGKISEGPAGTGALLVKLEAFEKVGLFNENLGYPKTIYEDLEYVMRIRKSGYKVLIDGREPLLHFKLSQSRIQGGEKNLEYIVKHYTSYFSFTKAYALYEALKVAPTRYKLEYMVYAILPITIVLVGLFSLTLSILTLFTLLLVSLLYSFISYGKAMNITLKIIAGPAILLSRISRALTLILYVIIKQYLPLQRILSKGIKASLGNKET
jgi:GT2 family glycosyltransferase